MDKSIFNGVSFIEIQGEKALNFINSGDNITHYELVGFLNPKISIYDHRPDSVKALKSYLMDLNPGKFLEAFCVLSHLIIREIPDGSLRIDLYPTNSSHSEYMLWVVIGIQNEVPVYPYLFAEFQEMEIHKFAFLSVYQRVLLPIYYEEDSVLSV
jgi:hypothetical protein